MRSRAGEGGIRLLVGRLYILSSFTERHHASLMLGEEPSAVRRPHEKTQGRRADREDHHETTGISQGGGRWDHDVRGRRAGYRPIDARGEMATCSELAEIPRYALWRMRILRQARVR